MSQPKVTLKNTNIVLGSGPTSPLVIPGDTPVILGMADAGNIVVGNNISESKNKFVEGDPNSLVIKPRLQETTRSIVIGNGPLKGIEKETTIEQTNNNTKVPNNAVLIGPHPAVPCEANGTTAADTDKHLIFGSGIVNDGLVGAVVVGDTTATHKVPIWYNGTRYYLLLATIPPPV